MNILCNILFTSNQRFLQTKCPILSTYPPPSHKTKLAEKVKQAYDRPGTVKSLAMPSKLKSADIKQGWAGACCASLWPVQCTVQGVGTVSIQIDPSQLCPYPPPSSQPFPHLSPISLTCHTYILSPSQIIIIYSLQYIVGRYFIYKTCCIKHNCLYLT